MILLRLFAKCGGVRGRLVVRAMRAFRASAPHDAWRERGNHDSHPAPHINTDTAFKQQRLPAWQPILTPKWVIITFSIIGTFVFVLGWT